MRLLKKIDRLLHKKKYRARLKELRQQRASSQYSRKRLLDEIKKILKQKETVLTTEEETFIGTLGEKALNKIYTLIVNTLTPRATRRAMEAGIDHYKQARKKYG